MSRFDSFVDLKFTQELKRVKKQLRKKNIELAVKEDEVDGLLAKANELTATKKEMREELEEAQEETRTATVEASRLRREKAVLQREVTQKGRGKRLLVRLVSFKSYYCSPTLPSFFHP